jgi:hypothetical protein
MCGLGDLAVDDLLEGVDALALAVESVHKMHSIAYQQNSQNSFKSTAYLRTDCGG